jgi:hypothetical protein
MWAGANLFLAGNYPPKINYATTEFPRVPSESAPFVGDDGCRNDLFMAFAVL